VSASDVEALIVGAGPVGLALALGLARRGVSVQVLEARAGRPPGTRAIGIHPPALAALAALGIAEALIERGIRVRRARAFGASGSLGTLPLDPPRARYPFVLCVPQPVGEGMLRDALAAAAPEAIVAARVTAVTDAGDAVRVRAVHPDGEREHRAAWLFACDGRDGVVRRSLGIGWRGGPYPDRFLMADLPDDGALPPDEATIALHPAGVMEAFPLPGGVRRFVVRVAEGDAPPATPEAIAERVAAIVAERSPLRPASRVVGSASAFGIEHGLASTFARGRVVWAGDAAHVLSPIGGQGMNLGWLDAAAFAAALAQPASRRAEAIAAAARRRRAAARTAIARAEQNTRWGRVHGAPAAWWRDAVLRALLSPPLAPVARDRFTMGGLA
jgi:2-polyprenyl-6-methoxyphenol hydroxylase-like FAD-dependent oxidoreductase